MHNRGKRVLYGLVASVMIAGVTTGLMQQSVFAADPPLTISGVVTDQHGTGIENVAITATQPNSSTVLYGPVQSAQDGSYALHVDAGSYDLHFDPPAGNGYLPIIQSSISISQDQSIDIQFVPPHVTHTISGTVTDINGNPVSGSISVGNNINSVNGSIDVSGHYSLTVEAGMYNMGALIQVGPSVIDVGVNDIDATFADAVQDLQIPPLVNLQVTTIKNDGTPTSASVTMPSNKTGSIYAINTLGTPPTSEYTSVYGMGGVSDANGHLTIPVPAGSTIPVGAICATFNTSASVCNSSSISMAADASLTITAATATHTISGVITDAEGNLMSGSISVGNNTNSASGAIVNGHYSLLVDAGVYNMGALIQVGPSTIDIGANDIDATNGDATQDLQMPQLVNLTVTVKDSNGVPTHATVAMPSDKTGSIYAINTLGTPPTSEYTFVYGMGGGTDVNGQLAVPVPRGSNIPAGAICATFQTGANTCNASAISMTADATLTLTATSPLHSVSGTFTDANGNPVSGNFFIGNSSTSQQTPIDGNGHYLVNVEAGMYNTGSLIQIGPSTIDIGATDINATNGDVVQNFALPQLVNLKVIAKDSNGSPVVAQVAVPSEKGGYIAIVKTLGTPPISEYVSVYAMGGITSSDGELLVPVPKDATIPVGAICVTYTTGPRVCNGRSIVMNSDATLILQAAAPTPAAPTNLAASSPAQTPSLSWSASPNATSYAVYRDGAIIGTSATTVYTDTTATVGSHVYYVTAINGGGESGPSNSVTVLVAIPPTITSVNTYTTSLRATVDFTVTTTGSPLPSLSETGNLPQGVTFTDNNDGTATFAGSPALGTAGTYPITITASDGINSPVTQQFTLTVTAAITAPAITSSNADTETYDVPFNFTVTTSGYPAPSLSKTGSLPTGVKFTDNGDGTATISGTAKAKAFGEYQITITATNPSSTASQTFTLTIVKTPVIKKIHNQNVRVGKPFVVGITAVGQPTPSLSASSLPSGIAFTDNGDGTATISGTPQAGSTGTYTITITATNIQGSSTQSFQLKIK